jgi:PhnB protein
MARTSIYLNFGGNTEQAFEFYKTVFNTQYIEPLSRMSDYPNPELKPEDANLVMHVGLPITGGLVLMGTDAPEHLGFNLITGNNISLNLEPDTRVETDRLFALLSAEGEVKNAMKVEFWGDYFGSCTDKYGICWMFNCTEKIN